MYFVHHPRCLWSYEFRRRSISLEKVVEEEEEVEKKREIKGIVWMGVWGERTDESVRSRRLSQRAVERRL